MTPQDASPDEMPLRAIHQLGAAVEETIKAHEARCPARAIHDLQQRSHRAPAAIPFPDSCVPDESLAKMVEALDTEPDLTIEALAARFDYPAALVERELAIYRARYSRWISTLSARVAG